LKLSKKKADFYSNLERFKKMMETGESITGILRRRVKGGMIVDIENIEAFLPGSQISTKPIPNLDQFIGKEGEFKILKIDEERRNIIVSRKKVLEEKRESQIRELKEKLRQGSELDGEVRNITDYGAFIDLGGIDGLLHITDMSWGHIKHPSDMLNIGDKIKVKVLSYDEETNKVALGIKQLVPPPWENIEVKYPEGSVVTGKVVNLTKYGVFVELEPGVEGLVHVSEMSWTKKIKHPNQIVKLGDTIKAIVLDISKDEHRISLGMKQMEPNPWLAIDERYPVGTVLKGKIKSITPFGVFVEIEKDIEGLIHISDISWTKRIYHPREVYKKGQEVEVKVLSIDKTLHRIALGVKQLTPDPWEHLDKILPINSEVKAKIVKIIPKGLLVDVPVNDNVVEGFVPLSHLGIPNLRKISDAFYINEELPLKTIELDLENRRLILSVKAYFFSREKELLQKFIQEHQERMREKLEKKQTKPPVQEKQEEKAIAHSSEQPKEEEPKAESELEKTTENVEETQTEDSVENEEEKTTEQNSSSEPDNNK
jgi:small subunit ribosomal protein S1